MAPRRTHARRYPESIKREFLEDHFEGDEERLSFESGELSLASCAILACKIDLLARDFAGLVELDLPLLSEENASVGLLLGVRPWVCSLMKKRQRTSG